MILSPHPSFIAGALFGALNFWLLVKIVSGFVQGGEPPKGKLFFYFFGKMTLLFVTIGLILWRGYVTPLPFLGGFSVSLLVGIAVVLWKGRKKIHA